MKKLILMRHAKSDWENITSDFERTITEKGISKTKLITQQLKDIKNLNIDLIFSSSAKRTELTSKIVAKELNLPHKIHFTKKLYIFSINPFINFIKNLTNNTNTIFIFGHNEALTDFINEYGNQYIENLPTSGCACIEFKINSWKEIKKGITNWILLPKDVRYE